MGLPLGLGRSEQSNAPMAADIAGMGLTYVWNLRHATDSTLRPDQGQAGQPVTHALQRCAPATLETFVGRA